jgi:hypothetical protein
MHNLDARWVLRGERFGDVARSVWRGVVNDEHANAVQHHQLHNENRQVGALVVRWDED